MCDGRMPANDLPWSGLTTAIGVILGFALNSAFVWGTAPGKWQTFHLLVGIPLGLGVVGLLISMCLVLTRKRDSNLYCSTTRWFLCGTVLVIVAALAAFLNESNLKAIWGFIFGP